jgi:hypothetical protein
MREAHAVGTERETNVTGSPRREVTAADLKKVKEGYNALVKQLRTALTISEFALVMRKAQELANQVGGIEALAKCAEELKEVQL